jgi:hypothetical protein
MSDCAFRNPSAGYMTCREQTDLSGLFQLAPCRSDGACWWQKLGAATTGKGSEGQGGQGDLQAESTEIPPHGYARTVPAALGQARPTALGRGDYGVSACLELIWLRHDGAGSTLSSRLSLMLSSLVWSCLCSLARRPPAPQPPPQHPAPAPAKASGAAA